MIENGLLEHFEYVTPDGERYKLTTGSGRIVMSFDGLGVPPYEIATQRSPAQHGETPVLYRFRPRIVQLVFRVDTGNRGEYWAARRKLVDVLRPNRQYQHAFAPGELRFHYPVGLNSEEPSQIKALKVFPSEGPSFSPRSVEVYDEFGFTEVLRFVAYDPIFFSTYTRTATLGPVDLNPVDYQLSFPMTFRGRYDNTALGLQFNSVDGPTFLITNTILYLGSFATFPTVRITGPIVNPVVTNATTNETLNLKYRVASGEIVTYILEEGNKRVESSLKGDITAFLTTDSNLETFHIEPFPGGSGTGKNLNTIRFTGYGPTEGVTVCTVQYRDRWVGI